MGVYWLCPWNGHSRDLGRVIQSDVPGTLAAGRSQGVTSFHPVAKEACDDQSDRSVLRLRHPVRSPRADARVRRKGRSQARDNYAKFKDAAETHNGTIEAVFTTASKGASEYSAKLMEFLKANTTASLDFAQELFGVKSPAEAMELWTSHTRKQFETLTAQAKELAELGQKVATETVEPIKATASKLYKPAA